MAKEPKEENMVALRMPLRIKEILTEKGLLLNDLATKMDVTRQALSRQVNGKMLIETAEKIAIALDVPLWQLFVSPKEFEKKDETQPEPTKVGMIICPHCQRGIEITGVASPQKESIVVEQTTM